MGPDVLAAEKIGGGNDDITEHWDVVNGSKTVLRSLGVVCRFVAMSMERTDGRKGEGSLLRHHILFPFSVFTQAE